MREIKLTKDCVASVDDQDYEELSKFNWHVLITGGIKYATRRALKGENGKYIYMHRQILGNVKLTDHIDGNGLNNCRSNLREATARQNAQNRHDTTSSNKVGVYWQKSVGKWHAQIVINNRKVYLGLFGDEESAYNRYVSAVQSLGEVIL
jgi:hypothetical protein